MEFAVYINSLKILFLIGIQIWIWRKGDERSQYRKTNSEWKNKLNWQRKLGVVLVGTCWFCFDPSRKLLIKGKGAPYRLQTTPIWAVLLLKGWYTNNELSEWTVGLTYLTRIDRKKIKSFKKICKVESNIYLVIEAISHSDTTNPEFGACIEILRNVLQSPFFLI